MRHKWVISHMWMRNGCVMSHTWPHAPARTRYKCNGMCTRANLLQMQWHPSERNASCHTKRTHHPARTQCKCGIDQSASKAWMTPVAGPIFGPQAQLVNLISRTDINPGFTSFLLEVISLGKLCCAQELSTRSIHESDLKNEISKASFWKRDRENVNYKCSNSGQMFLRDWKSFPTRLLGLGTK